MSAPPPPEPVRFPLPHYVLAGGRSRRFGSDKARHRIDGVPMVVRVAEAFARLASSTTVIAREANAYTDLGLPTVADDLPDAGPLAGLATALRLSNELSTSGGGGGAGGGWLLLTSCDLRRPDAATLTALKQALRQHEDACAAVYRRDGRFEPFPGLYHASIAGAVRDTLASPRRSFQSLLGGAGERVATAAWPAGGGPLDLDRRPGPP